MSAIHSVDTKFFYDSGYRRAVLFNNNFTVAHFHYYLLSVNNCIKHRIIFINSYDKKYTFGNYPE